jgi:nitrogen regulatory protein P-II 1
MRLVTAVIRPTRVGAVCDALRRFGIHGLTASHASGFGRMRGHPVIYRGVDLSSGFRDQVKLEIVVPDEDVSDVISVICRTAATGSFGDGKIWVTPVARIVRIRTEDADARAI